MRTCHLFLLCLLTLVATACGPVSSGPLSPVEPESVVDPLEPEDKEKTCAIIGLFGAPPCSACKSELPAVQAELNKRPASLRDSIQMRLYVPTGAGWRDAPTQETSDRYRDVLHLNAEAVPDPRWSKYAAIIGGSQVIPAGAVLSVDGKVLKVFRAGSNTFIPREIVSFAASQCSP